MLLDNLIGHDKPKMFLKNLIKKKQIPSTMLFTGPTGVGKALFANEFAKLVLQTDKDHHADISHIRPEGKSGLHKTETLQGLVRDIGLTPFEGAYRFFIIHDADRMLPSHSNALLKSLEEPPSSTKIILITANPHNIIDTIESRSINLPFFALPDNLVEIAIKDLDLSGISKTKLIKLACGSIGMAHLLHKYYTKDFEEQILALIKSAFSKKHALFFQTIEKIEEAVQQEKALTSLVFSNILYWYRDLHLLQTDANHDILFYKDEIKSLELCSKSHFPSFAEMEGKIEKAMRSLELNIRLKSALEYVFFSSN